MTQFLLAICRTSWRQQTRRKGRPTLHCKREVSKDTVGKSEWRKQATPVQWNTSAYGFPEPVAPAPGCDASAFWCL